MNGTITHYASGQAAIFCGAGYPTIPDVFKYGIIFGLVGWLVFGLVGMPWWKFLGYF
jgi:divalent anion:Na+ symporter, DASS family